MTKTAADTTLNEAEALWLSGQHQQAREALRRARMLYHQSGDSAGETGSRHALAHLLAALGNHTDSRNALRQALILYRRLNDPRAAEVEAELRRLEN